MVPRNVLAQIARRYDTAMSAAMLRALGERPPRWRGRRRKKRPDEGEKYRGMMWCFRNHGSPMDRMR